MSDLEVKISSAKDLVSSNPEEAVSILSAIIDDNTSNSDVLKHKETVVSNLCDLFVLLNNAEGLKSLLPKLRDFFSVIPKAKTAKIVRNIIDSLSKIPNSEKLQVEVCKEQIEWAKSQKRTFLKQRIELRLATLYLDIKEYQLSLGIISSLTSEVKRLDDKLLLVDIHLLESKVHHRLRSIGRARAALTAARTAANSIYVPVPLQAEIDCQSGILHAEERDFKTAYSYFFEAFEQLSALDEERAVRVLKYMLLCKVMLDQSDEVPAVIGSKAGLRFAGPEVDAMRAVAQAHRERSLKNFQEVLGQFKKELVEDVIVDSHLSALYDNLLEQNLERLIEPFSRVEIAHLSELIELDQAVVEKKLSQMILDKKLLGTLDQGAGCLEIFEPPSHGVSNAYSTSLRIIENLERVVETLAARSQKVYA
uniref:PCI domain-containing protein n=1 Tax=Polytomella parva TaxID=51329 RepID=A0A7S0V359_9CHLO|mmetsp:Transcript_29382/g.53911  ORF Transcript_29382/g.53911 Transcript_29382/m.53911 type:complete len:422 (+) Transcript_29382:75-1340(+)|eukprot:CAMPEP_0175041116 /NCGR_PEP_ID=MMETSP0052_2-20121109/1723_1 /TAXON_ID=51329 ORGANISM="Polytomella parva, Strain SAG 63-3" /NCGR_SAMPLE_ID=MMETSP0052_2 /ASSEMBLY_ACC=CAM_ASM_000194 /LENGTH=421 /DNA_ID=CAMNT_0016303569 /DNA_START=59 /DNA_END=1324 /DNA_ORIENTATION=+